MSITLGGVGNWADLLPIGIKILFAVIIFVIGRTVIRAVSRALDRGGAAVRYAVAKAA